MKYLFVLILASVVGARAGHAPGNAVEYHFAKSYLVIATTDQKAFLELRSYNKDLLLDSVVLSSRSMPPDFEAKGLGLDSDSWEFRVWTRDGGAGFAETHLAIYAVIGEHISKVGDFVIDRDGESRGNPTSKKRLKGEVSVQKKRKLRSHYTQVVTQNGKTMTNSVKQSFTLKPRTMEYEQTRKP